MNHVGFKARPVAKRLTQKERVDFKEVLSPIVKYNSMRLLQAIAAFFDLELDKMYVRTAFLHSNLDEEIFMAQLEGFTEE